MFTDTRVVTARLLFIMVKHAATFLLELQSTWVFPIYRISSNKLTWGLNFETFEVRRLLEGVAN